MTEQTQPTDAELYLNVASQCEATATSELAKNVLVDGGSGTLRELLNDAADAIRAGWGTPAGAGEPVAWMSRLPSGSEVFARTKDFYQDAVPVYLAPQHTQAQAGAVPLTDEQIEEIAKQFITRVGSHWEHDDAIPDNGRIEDFVRAIEHAHGIKGADHG